MGLCITDSLADLDKGSLSDVFFLAGDLFVVDVDDSTVGFKLAGDEEVHLTDCVTVLDSVDWSSGQSPAEGSFARQADGSFVTALADTRGQPNE